MEKLTELINFAIQEEIKANKLYTDASQKIEDKSAQEMLKDMAEMEKGHEAKLRALKEGRVEKIEAEKVQDLKIGNYLADVELRVNSTIQEILIYAIKSEMKAFDLYTDLSRVIVDADKKALLAGLASEELKHKNSLEVLYDDNINREN
jgi:rubrerythrin